MNIALVSREFPPFYGGGIGTYTEQAAWALASAGHAVIVVTASEDGTRRREHVRVDDSGKGYIVERLPLVIGDDWSRPAPSIDSTSTRGAFRDLGPWAVFSMQVARALPGLVAEHRIDVIEGAECGASLWWALHARRLGAMSFGNARFVVHLHSPTAWIDRHNRFVARRRTHHELAAMEEEAARLADLVVAPSVEMVAWGKRVWGLGAIGLLPHPLGAMEADARRTVTDTATPASLGAPDGSLGALFVGRLEPRKGVDVLLRAVAIAERRGTAVSVSLAGQDTLDARTGMMFAERAATPFLDPPLRSRVRMHGKVDRSALKALRREADVFVAPAAIDNFPYALVESMAAGLPVITSRTGGGAELVRDGIEGFLFTGDEPAELAEALARVAAMTPPARREMGRRAAARVIEFCSNERAIRVRERVFTEALGAGWVTSAPTSDADPRCEAEIVGDTAGLDDIDRGDLIRAVEQSGAGFGVGWERVGTGANSRVRARGTPTPRGLVLGGEIRGPIAVRRSLIETWRALHPDQRPMPVDMLPWLIARGIEGVVVPWVESVRKPVGATDPALAMSARELASLGPFVSAMRRTPLPWPVVKENGREGR